MSDPARDIRLIRATDLARAFGYKVASPAFRTRLAEMRITPVRPGWFDPALVRRRMDEAQGLGASAPANGPGVGSGLVAQRRARIGKS